MKILFRLIFALVMSALALLGAVLVANCPSCYGDPATTTSVPFGSPRVVYASRVGIFQDSDQAGGGHDDTLALKAALDAMHSTGGGTFIMDKGYAMVSATGLDTTHWSAVQTYGNINFVFQPGTGIFQKANSNCVTFGNFQTGNYNSPTDFNISVSGFGTINCNGANQSGAGTETAPPGISTPVGTLPGVWFGGFQKLVWQDVRILNAPTFGFVVSQGSRLRVRDLIVENPGSAGRNGDGIHLWGTLDDCVFDDCRVIGGNDDGLALNFAEYIGAGDPRRGSTGGFLNNIVFNTTRIQTTGHCWAFNGDTVGSYYPTLFPSVGGTGNWGTNIFIRGMTVDSSAGWVQGVPQMGTVGFQNCVGMGNATTTYTNNYGILQLNGIFGTTFGYTTASVTSGDYFNTAVNGLNSVVLSGTPAKGQIIAATGSNSAAWQNPTTAIPVNTALPTLSSTSPRAGTADTVTTGTWTQIPLSYAYQWQSSTDGTTWSNISSGTNSAYTSGTGDVGKYLRGGVAASNLIGTSTTAYTIASGTVATGTSTGLLTSLLGYWTFNESSGNFADSTSGAHTLTNTSVSSTSGGLLGNAAVFNGSSSVASNATLGSGYTGAQSVAFWFKLANPSSGTRGDPFSSAGLMGLDVTETSGTFTVYYDPSTSPTGLTATTHISDTNWHHFAVCIDSSHNLKIYIDGSAAGSVNMGANTAPWAGGIPTAWGNSGGGSFWFAGDIQQSGIWQADISSLIGTLYNSGSPLPYSSW